MTPLHVSDATATIGRMPAPTDHDRQDLAALTVITMAARRHLCDVATLADLQRLREALQDVLAGQEPQ